jgi:outer membrane protein assembly factor BamB
MPSETDPPALWQELRSWPRYVQFGFAGLALVVFAATFAVEPLYEPDFPDRSAWPEGRLPNVIPLDTIDTGPDESGSERPEGVEPYRGDPLWTASFAPDGEQVARVDHGILRWADGRIEMERDGDTAWVYHWESEFAEVGVAGEVVIVSERLGETTTHDYEWPGRSHTVALDLDTGEEVWRDQDASFVSAFADAIFMTECTGAQDDRLGDCTLYSRDPADLSEQWSTPTYASAQIASGVPWSGAPAPDRLLVESYPTGHDSRTVTVVENGERLLSVPTGLSTALAGDTLIVYDDRDDNPADGCTADLTGYRLGGSEPAWEIQAMTRKTADLTTCRGLPTIEARDGKLPLTIDGVPSIVDVATGDAVWEAPAEGQAIAVAPDTLVTADWEAEEDNLVAYDTATGEERWRANAIFASGDNTWSVGSTLWLHGNGDPWLGESHGVHAYNLTTGEGVALPGVADYFIPGRIATITGETDIVTRNVWPTELW